MSQKIDLNKVVITESDSLVANVPYREGIVFKLKYISRAKLSRIGKSCTRLIYDETQKARVSQVDPDKLVEQFCAQSVCGWSGVTLRSLSRIVDLDISQCDPTTVDSEIDFSQDQLLPVVRAAYGLDAFLQESACDIKVFRPDLEAELGNLRGSQTGS